jgi:uncharacterized YigZ family protein
MTYTTITAPTTAEYKDKGSKFIAYTYPLVQQEAVKGYVEALRNAHPKACHWCFAWRLGTDKQHYRANDDGEPSGSAGRPILGQIDSAGLTDVLVIVVRYYGGINLGVPGLIKAYKTCTADALRQAIFIEKETQTVLDITCEYAELTRTMQTLRKHEGIVLSQYFEGNNVILSVQIAESAAAFFEI